MADGEDSDLPEDALLVEPAEVLSLLDARIAKLNESSTSKQSGKPPEHKPTPFPSFQSAVDADLCAAHLTTGSGTIENSLPA